MPRTRDERTADEATEDRSRLCRAHGCPGIWTIDSSRLCSWHHWAQEHDWPRVTEDLLVQVTQRAIARSNTQPTRRYTLPEKREILGKLRALFVDKDQENPRAWAWRLKARDDAGQFPSDDDPIARWKAQPFTNTQRAMYRAVTDFEAQELPATEEDLRRTAALKANAFRQAERYAKARGIELAPSPETASHPRALFPGAER